ncbi:MAG: tripartite tricarboxylate transporter substrate binding protein [Betaproteobacteria bacterium]|nr:tripartite tricarboxylate transporter substrate binding protein [Betaproteobacteria bacterium]
MTTLSPALQRCALIAALVPVIAPNLHAQDAYPTRPITMIVPFAAGNVTDIVARLIGERLAAALAQPVVIDNKPGASSFIGMTALSRAPADGYTLGVSATGPMATNPALFGKLPYDPVEGVSVVSVVFLGPTLILVDPASPLRTLADLIKVSQSQPEGLDYATAGIGSTMHLSGELLTRTTGARLRHIPNRGSGQAAVLLLGKQVPLLLDSATAALSYVRSGRMRALAITSAQRMSALPDIPTLTELGYPDVVVNGWVCVVTPPGVPAAIRARLADEVRKLMTHPEIQKRIVELGGVPLSINGEDSVAFVKAEQRRWGDLIRSFGIKLD